MTNAQIQFLKEKNLADKWTAIAVTDDFQKVITYARATLVEGGSLTPDMMAGVNLLATTLVSMCNAEEAPSMNYSTGLIHDLQPKRKISNTEEKKD